MKRVLVLLLLLGTGLAALAQTPQQQALEQFRTRVYNTVRSKPVIDSVSPFNLGNRLTELSYLQQQHDSLIRVMIDSGSSSGVPPFVQQVSQALIAQWNLAYSWGPHIGKYDTLNSPKQWNQIIGLGTAGIRNVPSPGSRDSAGPQEVVLGKDRRLSYVRVRVAAPGDTILEYNTKLPPAAPRWKPVSGGQGQPGAIDTSWVVMMIDSLGGGSGLGPPPVTDPFTGSTSVMLTLSQAPNPAFGIEVFLNTVWLPPVDYSITGSIVNLLIARDPDDYIHVRYKPN